MNEDSHDQIDWSLTTWEGSRRAQLRAWMALSLTEKWQAVEDMADWGRATIKWRVAKGLPYIDPYSGERIAGTMVREESGDKSISPENSETRSPPRNPSPSQTRSPPANRPASSL